MGGTTSALRQLLDSSTSHSDPTGYVDDFSSYLTTKGITPYPAQEEALLHLAAGDHVVLATPTGSGKSMVALGGHFMAAVTGRRSVYTAPIKALVSEKFFTLCDEFGADMVGMATGDAAVNPDAPIVCCTAEVLANNALRQGPDHGIGLVIMDEFHYYGDPQRGWAWQVPLVEMPNAQFLLMSATLGDTTDLSNRISDHTGRDVATVTNAERPVPLIFNYSTTPLPETIEELLYTKQSPIYIVHFTQAAATEHAASLMSVNMCSKDDKAAIAAALGAFRFSAGFGKTLSRLLRHGIGVHHAGMLPKYRRLVEQLAQQGLLKVICGTDTLGVGINVPIRTVLIAGLTKFDGTKQRHLSVREFHQIAGRAGRAGYDTVGSVVVQAPEHEIANLKAAAKAADNPKKKKIVKQKPPAGTLGWTVKTYERLMDGEPEQLRSHLEMSHSTVLNVIARGGDVVEAMRGFIRNSHETRERQNDLILQAISIYRSLLNADVVTWDGDELQLTVDVPDNFALNQPLSPFAMAALELLDPASETFALDVVSTFEATLEDPRLVLRQQLSKAKAEAVAEMKADGLEYNERRDALEDVSYPKPLAEVLDHAFTMYTQAHPWIANYYPMPKSVVRDMWERAMSFGEYIAYYKLGRSEGVLLRYLTDAYRALKASVPTSARTDELDMIIEWLGQTVRLTDSSLLDEWSELVAGAGRDGAADAPAAGGPPREQRLSDNEKMFTTLIRAALFRRVELAALDKVDELGELDGPTGFGRDQWDDALEAYYDTYDAIEFDADARRAQYVRIEKNGDQWDVRQSFVDPDKNLDWGITATVDIPASNDAGAPVITVIAVNDDARLL